MPELREHLSILTKLYFTLLQHKFPGFKHVLKIKTQESKQSTVGYILEEFDSRNHCIEQ